MLEFHNVNYFFDGDNYYKKINNHTLKKISKEEFYKKSKYDPKTIDKLLHQSVYAGQINDYILLRIPKWLKIKLNLKKKYIPADYQLYIYIYIYIYILTDIYYTNRKEK